MRFDVALIGGDTVRGPLGMSVTVLGRVRPGRFVPRSGARPGDGVYVTGHPGDAVAGRLLLGSSRTSARRRDACAGGFSIRRRGCARARGLAGIASAMMDISDGLHDDAPQAPAGQRLRRRPRRRG